MVVTSDNPAAHIKSKSTGKILAINYKPGDSVFEGDVLGELENNGNSEDILYLKNQLKTPFNEIHSLEILATTFSPQLSLGSDIQLFYNTYLNNYQNLILDQSLRDYNIHDAELKSELYNQRLAIQNKKEEIVAAERNLEVSKKNYDRYKGLIKKGVVSQLDLDATEKYFLNDQRQYYSLKQDYNQLMLENWIFW